MNSNKILGCLLIFLILFSSGCSNGDHSNDTPVWLSNGDVNKTIIMMAPEGCNSFLIDSVICIAVILQGNDPVIVSANAVNTFKQNDSEWTSIDDGVFGKQIKFSLPYINS